jgi:toxin ParE1/3/4
MQLDVLLTQDAERDLEEIYQYITEHESAKRADDLLDRFLEALSELSTFPGRGSVPKELRSVGVQDYRQTVLKPDRIIYRILGTSVVVYVIADGRRDMQTLLLRRLLSGQ